MSDTIEGDIRSDAPAVGALGGIRVVDLTRILAGPFCSKLLGDMGAEVIKIETPDGDPVRKQGAMVDGFSWYFAEFNRNKRSVVLDLYSDAGKDVLAKLIETADVLIENYRPGVLAKMGFTQERLDALNPRLIVASVNGYGSTGPYVDRPAFDFIAQAMSGFMASNGDPDGPARRAAAPISDLVAGLYCAFGVVSAPQARTRTGRGQQVESSLTGGLISMLSYLSAEYFATGQTPTRTGNNHPIVSPYGLFEASDGEIAVAPSHDTMVRRFLGVLGIAHLLDQPEYKDNPSRMRNRSTLNAAINAVTRTQSVDHWIDVINKAGCPAGRIMEVSDVFTDPQVLSQGLKQRIDHPVHGPMYVTGFPVKLSDTPCTVQAPPPDLGADTEAVLRELGITL